MPRFYISEPLLQTFSWWKEPVWKESCMWVERKGSQADSEKNRVSRLISQPWRWQEHPIPPWGSWVLSWVPTPAQSRSTSLLSPCSTGSIFLLLPLCCWLMLEGRAPSSACQPSCSASPSQRRRFGQQPPPSHSSRRTGQACSQSSSRQASTGTSLVSVSQFTTSVKQLESSPKPTAYLIEKNTVLTSPALLNDQVLSVFKMP